MQISTREESGLLTIEVKQGFSTLWLRVIQGSFLLSYSVSFFALVWLAKEAFLGQNGENELLWWLLGILSAVVALILNLVNRRTGLSILQFNLTEEVVYLQPSSRPRGMKVPLSWLSHFEIRLGKKNNLQILAIWNNDSEWWIYSSKEPAEIHQLGNLLSQFTGLSILNSSRDEQTNFSVNSFQEKELESKLRVSPFLQEGRLHGTLKYTLHLSPSLVKRLARLLILLWGGFVGYLGIIQSEALGGFSSLTQLVITGLLVVVYVLLLWLVVANWQYSFQLKAAGIYVQLSTMIPWLGKFISPSYSISPSQIQAIHINRNPGNRFVLALELSPDVSRKIKRSFLLRLAILDRGIWNEEKAPGKLILWDVSGLQLPKYGPYLGDMVALQLAVFRSYLQANGVQTELYNER